jgi:hypothetical protein
MATINPEPVNLNPDPVNLNPDELDEKVNLNLNEGKLDTDAVGLKINDNPEPNMVMTKEEDEELEKRFMNFKKQYSGKTYEGDYFVFKDYLTYYFPCYIFDDLLQGILYKNLKKLDENYIESDLRSKFRNFKNGETRLVDIRIRALHLSGLYYMTKQTGKLDVVHDGWGVEIKKTPSLLEKINPFTKRRKGGSKKRFKKTRKQRKHRNSKRNNKK